MARWPVWLTIRTGELGGCRGVARGAEGYRHLPGLLATIAGLSLCLMGCALPDPRGATGDAVTVEYRVPAGVRIVARAQAEQGAIRVVGTIYQSWRSAGGPARLTLLDANDAVQARRTVLPGASSFGRRGPRIRHFDATIEIQPPFQGYLIIEYPAGALDGR